MNEEHTELKVDVTSIDRATYVLTNRTGPFSSGVFSSSPYFKPWDNPTTTWLAIQEALMLDKPDTDYYIMIALNLLETHSHIKDKIENYTQSFVIQNFPKYAITIEDAELVSYGNRNSNFKKHKTPFPIPRQYRFVGLQGGRISVNTENIEIGRFTPNIINHRATSENPNNFVIISGNWDRYLPFEGSIKVRGQWEAGSSFTIDYHPKSIDYKEWLSHILSTADYEKFLDEVGLLETFRLSKQTTEQIAIFYLALIQHWDIENS